MEALGSLTSFGGNRYCGDRRFAGSKVFSEVWIEGKNMVALDPLTSFGGRK